MKQHSTSQYLFFVSLTIKKAPEMIHSEFIMYVNITTKINKVNQVWQVK